LTAELHETDMTSAKHATPDLQAHKPSELYIWYLLIFLLLAGTISYVDRQILSLMIGPVKRDLGISDTQVGLLIGVAFSVFYSLVMLPMAWLADTKSRRATIGAGLFGWSLMTTLSGIAQNFGQLFVARMGVGIGEAALGPSAYSLLADTVPRERLPFAIGVYAAAPFIGIGLANILGGSLVGALETMPPVHLPLFGELRSWQVTFLVVGLPGVALSLLAFTLREPVRHGLVAPDAGAGDASSFADVLRFMGANVAFFAFHFGGFMCLALQGWMLFGWIVEFYIREHAMARADIGQIYGVIAFVAGLVGSLVSGRVAMGMISRGATDATIRLSMLCAIAMAPLFVTVAMAGNTTLSLALLAPLTFFMAGPPGLSVAALQAMTPNRVRGRVVAIYLILTSLIAIAIGPVLVGLINDYVFRSDAAIGKTLAVTAAVTYPLAALLLFLCLKPFGRALRAAETWH